MCQGGRESLESLKVLSKNLGELPLKYIKIIHMYDQGTNHLERPWFCSDSGVLLMVGDGEGIKKKVGLEMEGGGGIPHCRGPNERLMNPSRTPGRQRDSWDSFTALS